jgi:hypothetical protein
MKPTLLQTLLTDINALEPRWLDQLARRDAAKFGSAKYRRAVEAADTIENEASQLAFGDNDHTLLQSVRKARLLVAAERLLRPDSGTDDCIRFLNEEEAYEWEVNETALEDIAYTDTPVERAQALMDNYRNI